MPQDSKRHIEIKSYQNSRSTGHSKEYFFTFSIRQKAILQLQAQYFTKSPFIRKTYVSNVKFLGNLMSSKCLTSREGTMSSRTKTYVLLFLQSRKAKIFTFNENKKCGIDSFHTSTLLCSKSFGS